MRLLGLSVSASIVWIMSTSFLMCLGRDHLELFIFPYGQWIEAALAWQSMLWLPKSWAAGVHHPLPWFFMAPLLPTAVAWGVVRWLRPRAATQTEELYGGSEWGGDEDLSSGKMRARRF